MESHSWVKHLANLRPVSDAGGTARDSAEVSMNLMLNPCGISIKRYQGVINDKLSLQLSLAPDNTRPRYFPGNDAEESYNGCPI